MYHDTSGVSLSTGATEMLTLSGAKLMLGVLCRF